MELRLRSKPRRIPRTTRTNKGRRPQRVTRRCVSACRREAERAAGSTDGGGTRGTHRPGYSAYSQTRGVLCGGRKRPIPNGRAHVRPSTASHETLAAVAHGSGTRKLAYAEPKTICSNRCANARNETGRRIDVCCSGFRHGADAQGGMRSVGVGYTRRRIARAAQKGGHVGGNLAAFRARMSNERRRKSGGNAPSARRYRWRACERFGSV